ncbi:MAG: pyridoxal kinase [Rhizobiaceae bacterium]|jgi:pyridoxine kinase|nr:pyridoxal kinase [Rhizobiaceae bacterium]
MTKGDARRAVMVISSHVAAGAVGNRIMTPVLETMGFDVIAVPTITLPWHPGMTRQFGQPTRLVPDAASFEALLADLARVAKELPVAGVISGYLGDASQAAPVAALVRAVKSAHPAAMYLCDPVTGDAGGLYVPEATARAIRDQLVPLADIVTPNAFELGWLTGQPVGGLRETVMAARALGRATVAVTSTTDHEADETGVALVEPDSAEAVFHPRLPHAANGTGDMFAAAFLGKMLAGAGAKGALLDATGTVARAAFFAHREGLSHLSPPGQRIPADTPDLRHVTL